MALLRCVASELGTKLCHLGLGVAIGVVISVAFLVTGPELLRGVHLLGSEPPAVGEIEVIDRVARHAKAGEPLDAPDELIMLSRMMDREREALEARDALTAEQAAALRAELDRATARLDACLADPDNGARAADAAALPRVAVLLAGGLRGFEVTMASWERFVVAANAHRVHVDVFMHVVYSERLAEHAALVARLSDARERPSWLVGFVADAFYGDFREIYSNIRRDHDKASIDRVEQISGSNAWVVEDLDMFRHNWAADAMRREYADARALTYDGVLRARPEMLLHTPLDLPRMLSLVRDERSVLTHVGSCQNRTNYWSTEAHLAEYCAPAPRDGALDGALDGGRRRRTATAAPGAGGAFAAGDSIEYRPENLSYIINGRYEIGCRAPATQGSACGCCNCDEPAPPTRRPSRGTGADLGMNEDDTPRVYHDKYHDMINDQVAFGGGCVMEHYARLYEIVPSLAEKIFTGEGPLDYARVGFSRPNPEMYTSTNLALANVAVKCSDDLIPYVLVAPRGGKVGRRRRAKRRRP